MTVQHGVDASIQTDDTWQDDRLRKYRRMKRKILEFIAVCFLYFFICLFELLLFDKRYWTQKNLQINSLSHISYNTSFIIIIETQVSTAISGSS